MVMMRLMLKFDMEIDDCLWLRAKQTFSGYEPRINCGGT